MTVTLYDSTTAADIPADAPAVAGYVDGAFANYHELLAAHPGKPVVGITVLGSFLPGTRVADVESGDLTPVSGAAWCRQMLTVGKRPTLYYSRTLGAAVRDALVADGLNPADVDYWPADWTGGPHLLPGSVATQYANPATSGGHYDLSVATEAWLAGSIAPGPTPIPPGPGPGPTPTPGGFMPPTLRQGALSGAVRNAQRLLNVHGAGLVVDGSFGQRTEVAVRNFQSVFHLSVDGIVGPATWSALDTFG